MNWCMGLGDVVVAHDLLCFLHLCAGCFLSMPCAAEFAISVCAQAAEAVTTRLQVMLQKLKTECGYQFTCKLEGMFTDMKTSADTMAAFRKYVSDNNIALRTDISVQVRHTAWLLRAKAVMAQEHACMIAVCVCFCSLAIAAHEGPPKQTASTQPCAQQHIRHGPPVVAQHTSRVMVLCILF
jgi:hypothetical protein